LYGYITTHGQQNIKKGCIFLPAPLRSYPDTVRYRKYFGRNFQNFWNCCSGVLIMTGQDDSHDDEELKDKMRRKAMSLTVELRVLDQLQ